MERRAAGFAVALSVLAAAPLFAQTPIQPGARVRGSLAAGDATLSSGEYNDVYTIAGRAGQRLVIRLSSTAFDAYLLMRGPADFSQDNDDAAQGNNDAQLDVRLPADGTYRIVATSYRAGEQGDYTLEVTEGSASQVAGNPAASGGGPITAGQTQRGTLARGDDTLRTGELADVWRFQGRRGQQITVRLASSDFDPYLLVRGPGNFTSDNDDDASERGSHNSRIDATLPADGEYRIMATSYRSGESGSYTISVESGSAGAAPQNTPRPQPIATIAPGQVVNGRIEQGDQTLRSGEFVDRYTLQGTSGQRLELRLNSTEFDPYVQINGPNGFAEYNDDDVDGSGGSNSHLVVTLPATGSYVVSATSYRPGESGAYQLSVNTTNAVSAGAGAAVAANRLTVGQAIEGSLARGDDTLQDGELVDRYRFEGRAGQRIAIDLASSAFDAYVQLISPTGRQEENDDAGTSTSDARLESILGETGTYTILATSLSRGMSGAYRLSLGTIGSGRVAAASPATPNAPAPAPVAASNTLTMGQALQGRLQQGDQTLRSGEFVDRYAFTGRRGQVVTVEMTSGDLDPYLLLQAPGGAQQENDDASTTDRNSRITWALPADGSYTVMATTYRPGEAGGYTLRLSAGNAAPTPAVAANNAASMGTPSTQRVYALLVGISDYGGRANNLAYTAEDARKMAESLNRAGVLAQQSVVLTDGDATYDRVRSAFQQIASQAGPDDVFLFFYSGHGTQTREDASNTSEPDRRDEAIVLRDRTVTDNEMSQWFSAVRSRMAIIALDACFSGGFARDVVNRPGVMGFFSSEEDLTSAVAGKFQAGGYLSHFLRSGLAGEADSDHDRRVTAGELSTYVHHMFNTQAAGVEAETMERQRNYQFPVIDRGGVKIDDVVLYVSR